MEIIDLILYWTVLALGGCILLWKIVEILRDAIFSIDVDRYIIRSGRCIPVRDWALKTKSKHKSNRYFLLKALKSVIDVDYDCIERIGKRDRLTLIEKAPGQFSAVRREFVMKNEAGEGTIMDPTAMLALIPRASKEEEEALMDLGDEVASPAFLPKKSNRVDLQALFILIIFIAGLGAVAFINMKYFEQWTKSTQMLQDTVIQTNCRQFARDEMRQAIMEANKTGAVPSWVFEIPEYRKIESPGSGVIAIDTVNQIIG